MSNAAMIVILASMAARRKLAERLIAEGATTPEHARALSKSDAGLADDLVRKGVLREAAPGRFYVDEAAFAAWDRAGSDPATVRRVAIVIGIALLVLLAIVLLALLTG